MKSMGNKRAKEYWEANVPRDYQRPTEHDSQYTVKKWIVAKYEEKSFCGQTTPPSGRPSSAPASPVAPQNQSKKTR